MEHFLKNLKLATLKLPSGKVSESAQEEKTIFMEKTKSINKNLLSHATQLFQVLKKKPILISASALLGILILGIAISTLLKKPPPPILEEVGKESVKKEAASKKPAILEKDMALSKEFYQQGLEHTAKEEWIEAIKDFEEALRYHQENDQAYYELGYAYSQLSGRNNEAQLNMKKAIALNPQNAMYKYSLGLVYLNYGRKDLAIKEWEKALEIDPGNPTIQAVLKKYKP